MVSKRLIKWTAFLVVGGMAELAAAAGESPTAGQALGLTPIQSLVEYANPSKEEAAQCTIRAEKESNATAWVVRNRQGEILRRFADTNGDNVVDLWCYYLNGLEVYRDIDANFNGKADQYRWFHTAGYTVGCRHRTRTAASTPGERSRRMKSASRWCSRSRLATPPASICCC